MTRKLLVGAVAVGALAVTAGTAFALSSPSDTSGASAAPVTTSTSTSTSAEASGLPADDARRIAVDLVQGTVDEVEREVEHGRTEWKVEVIAADGHTYDVRVDAETGAVTRVDQDDDRDGDDD